MKNLKQTSFIQKVIFGTIIALVAGISLYLVFTPAKKPKKVLSKVTKPTTPIPRLQPPVRPTKGYPEAIKGEIVTLKILTADSAFDYYAAFDEDVRKYLEFPAEITYGYVERYVRSEAERIQKGEMIAYNIWDNVDNKMVGSLQIRDLNEEDPGQLGMWLNKNYRGGGRIQEAMYLISKAYFDAKPMEKKYIAYVRPWNPRSERAMVKFGFKKVGETTFDGEPANILELYREIIDKKAKERVKTL